MSDRLTLIAATHNPGKLPELRAGLSGLGVRVLSLAEAGLGEFEMPEETGKDFAENARIKARAVYEKCGRGVFADDSGLAVDALGGEPGVYSARYAPPGQRRRTVLAKLAGVGPSGRAARFVCAVCCILPDGRMIECSGSCEGSISLGILGEGGFGYDSIFIPRGYAETFGQLPPGVKEGMSHRAEALRALAEKLKEML